jgi:4-amino-4-deoxy-L-arabinose transferase-like glycosyltransferase
MADGIRPCWHNARVAGVWMPAPISRRRPRVAGAPEEGLLPQVRLSRVVVLITLGMILIASLAFLMWGIAGDLPYSPDVDEPDFLGAAIRMLNLGTINPGWFGHPGSTVIYPIAALAEIWYLLAGHLPPFAHPMHGIAAEFTSNPTPFYLIGRSVSAAYAVGTVGATWLVGRRLVGDLGGLLAALMVLAVPVYVQYGQLVRTDTAGAFFALIALWLAIRAMAGGRFREWALAAGAIGLAVSTRWFYVLLVVPYAVAAFQWWRWKGSTAARPSGRMRPSWIAPVGAIVVAPVAFLATSPSLLPHLRRAIADIRVEARTVQPGADGLSPAGNLQWYVFDVIPWALGSLGVVLAALGLIVLVQVERRRATILIAFALSYLVGVSASPLHWTRYVIPLIPILAIFAAAGALAIGVAVTRAIRRWSAGDDVARGLARLSNRPWRIALAIAAMMVVVAIATNVSTVVFLDRTRAAPSTRVLATAWIEANLPASAPIAQEFYAAYLDERGDTVTNVFALGSSSLDSYRSRGTRYLVTSSAMSNRFTDSSRYPAESTFYRTLATDGRLLASFGPTDDRAGPTIQIYDLGP